MKKILPILLVIWGLISTGAAVYLWNNAQKTEEINKTLAESNSIHKKLVANEYESYQAIYKCFVEEKGMCQPEEFKKKLNTLGDEADVFSEQIFTLEQQLKIYEDK